MVFQSYALFPNMTVAENVGFGLKVRHAARADDPQRVDELLELIHLSDGRPLSLPAVGWTAAARGAGAGPGDPPQVLLLDEPLSALDAKIRISLRNEIRAIQRQLGITTIYVTHDQEEALSLSDRVVVMSPADRADWHAVRVYNFPTTPFVASFVGTLNLVAARVMDAGAGRLSIDGQEVRTPHGPSGRGGGRQRLGRGPAGGDRPRAGQEGRTDSAGQVEDINFLGSIVRLRLALGDAVAGSAPTTLALDNLQRAAPDAPGGRRADHGLLPLERRASSSRRPAATSAARSAALVATAQTARPSCWDRPRRLRQGRHPDRLPRDVERLGTGSRGDWGPRPGATCGCRCTGLGYDHATGRADAHGQLAATPMARIREHDPGGPARGQDRPRTRPQRPPAAWHAPDLVELAVPAGGPGDALRPRSAPTGRRLAVATADDRGPTAAHARRHPARTALLDAVVCADDGLLVKPAPDMVLAICRALGVVPAPDRGRGEFRA